MHLGLIVLAHAETQTKRALAAAGPTLPARAAFLACLSVWHARITRYAPDHRRAVDRQARIPPYAPPRHTTPLTFAFIDLRPA